MAARAGARRGARQVVDCDLELRPLMNVFIVLIPMLLMSAVFIEIRVIEMSQAPAGATASAAQAARPLDLMLRVSGGAYSLSAEGLAPIAFARLPLGHDGALDPASSSRLADALRAVVAAHPGTHEIHIVAEPGTRYQELVALMDLARSAGLPDAALEGVREGA